MELVSQWYPVVWININSTIHDELKRIRSDIIA
jgi:hypothetical protein